MVQEQVEQGKSSEKKRGRSPGYPAISLDEAIERARTLYEAVRRNWVNIDTVLNYWGYKAKSGAGLVVVAALKKYGLAEDQGSGDRRQVRLTEDAFKILVDDRPSSPEREALIREAALKPPIHAELWNYYAGSLPSDQNLRVHLLMNRKFTENGADEFIAEFRRTIEFARLDETVTISPEPEDKPEPHEKGGSALETPVPEKPREDPSPPISPDTRVYRWGLPGDREVEIRVPGSLTKDDIEAIEGYLEVQKKFIK